MGGWVVWKGFEPILDKLGTVGSCLMEVGGGGDLRVSKTDYFFPSMLLETQMRTIKDDQFVMIITQGMPIPWSEVLLRWRMHKLVLCNRGWLCSAWLEKLDSGWVVGTLGLGFGGVVLPPGLPNRALQLEALFSAAASPLEAGAKLKMFATSVLSHFPSPNPFFGKGSEKM